MKMVAEVVRVVVSRNSRGKFASRIIYLRTACVLDAIHDLLPVFRAGTEVSILADDYATTSNAWTYYVNGKERAQ